MKLKKTHVLLIAIAIFLLISIGSVCASENVTDTSDESLADDGTDVVLSDDTDENVPDGSEEKINTTVETDSDSYEFKQDSNKTIPVQVKDNKSNPIDVNKSDLSISNGNKSISFEYNSSVIKITEQLPYGHYNLTINYAGNGTYIGSYKNITVKIYGNNTIETETSVVCDGENIEIPVKVNDQVEDIELIKKNFNLTLIYTNEDGSVCNLTNFDFDVENGTIKFQTQNIKLINASVIIDYINATEPKTVAIKVSTEVKAVQDEYKFKSEEIKNISIEIVNSYYGNLTNINKTDLKVFDNGNEITNFEFNNSILTLDLGVGVHNITVTYLGNDTYNASTSQGIIVKVSGNNTIIVPDYVVSDEQTVEIPVTIFDGSENITATEDFTLNLTYTNSTGNVNSKIINDYTVENGLIKFNVDSTIKLIKASVTVNYVNSTGAKTVKINLKTNVTATAKDKYRFNETNNITVTVKDVAGNPLNIVKNDLKVFDNGNEVTTFNFNNSILTVTLAEGVHNLTIVYKGNDTYNSSSTTIEQKVYGDIKFNPDQTVILDENNKVTITINLNDGADLVEINETKLNVTLFYTIGNQTFNRTVSYTLNGQNITFDLTEDITTAYAQIKYAVNNLIANTTIKVNTKINASDLQFGESEVKNFTVEVKGTNGHNINLTKDNIQIINLKDGKALTIEVNNSTITIKDKLTYGKYDLAVKYLGQDAYLESSKNITLIVYGINATASTSINSTKNGEVKVNIFVGNETINVTASDLNVTASYKDGNNTVPIKVNVTKFENGTLYFTLENATFTTATLNIRYNNTEVNVTLNRKYNVKVEVINNEVEYVSGEVIFKIIDLDTNEPLANKTINLEYSIYTTVISMGGGGVTFKQTITANTNETGEVVFETSRMNANIFGLVYLSAGNHTVTLSGTSLSITNSSQNVIVNPADVNVAIEKYEEYYQSTEKVKIVVTNAKTGKPVPGAYILINITGATLATPRQMTDENGTIQLGVTGLYPNTFNMKFTTNDTNLINKTSSGSFIIKKIPVTISGKNVEIYYNSGTTYTIKVTKDGKALEGMYVIVRLYTTSSKYSDYLFQTDKKGQIAFSASLNVGKHKIIVASADTRYDAKQLTKTITVKKASAKITAKKVTDYYKGVKYFTVKLTNSKTKKAIYNAKINIKVYVSKNRYYNYNGNTGMNGQIKLALDTLKPGTYKVVVSGADSKNFNAKEVTTKIVIKKAPTKFIAKKLTAKKGKNKYFKITAKNKKTKKVIAKLKIKVKVYTGKKYKTYNLKTNSKGIAKLNVKKLKVGKHKVVITSANKYCVAKAKKSTIKIKK